MSVLGAIAANNATFSLVNQDFEVPEPLSISLLGFGLLALGVVARRRHPRVGTLHPKKTLLSITEARRSIGRSTLPRGPWRAPPASVEASQCPVSHAVP